MTTFSFTGKYGINTRVLILSTSYKLTYLEQLNDKSAK